MSSLAEFLFPAPAPRRAPAIVGWWERRRPAYNLMVGAAGAYSLVVIHVFGLLPPDPHGMGGEPLWWVPMVLGFGVMANVCYVLGPVLELLAHRVWGGRVLPVGPVLYRMGLTFSVGLALLPSLLAGFDWCFRIVRWLV